MSDIKLMQVRRDDSDKKEYGLERERKRYWDDKHNKEEQEENVAESVVQSQINSVLVYQYGDLEDLIPIPRVKPVCVRVEDMSYMHNDRRWLPMIVLTPEDYESMLSSEEFDEDEGMGYLNFTAYDNMTSWDRKGLILQTPLLRTNDKGVVTITADDYSEFRKLLEMLDSEGGYSALEEFPNLIKWHYTLEPESSYVFHLQFMAHHGCGSASWIVPVTCHQVMHAPESSNP